MTLQSTSFLREAGWGGMVTSKGTGHNPMVPGHREGRVYWGTLGPKAGEEQAVPMAPLVDTPLLPHTLLLPENCSWVGENKVAKQTWHALTQEEP